MFRKLSLQTEIFPCKGKYNAKELAALDKSWARVIKDKMLPFLVTTENKFAQFFDATMGRPIKYISLLIVLHVFKELYDWTDAELVDAACFDKRFEYAFELSFEEVIVCQKTLHNFRHLLLENEMARVIFEDTTVHIADTFNINTSQQRLDSSHIVSNMAKLSRLGLLVRVTENFLHKLKQVAPDRYQQLPERFAERYAQRRGYFADARSRKTQHHLGECANDMWYLIDRFRGDDQIASLKVMTLLQRVFNESRLAGRHLADVGDHDGHRSRARSGQGLGKRHHARDRASIERRNTCRTRFANTHSMRASGSSTTKPGGSQSVE